MKLKLPIKRESSEPQVIEANTLVIIGANGSGKTKFSSKIEEQMGSKAHRISANKSLLIPDSVSPTQMDLAEDKLFLGQSIDRSINENQYNMYRSSSRWAKNRILNDYSTLVELLFTEQYQKLVESQSLSIGDTTMTNPQTKLDLLKKLWEQVIPNKELKLHAGQVKCKRRDQPNEYAGSQMSDGERVAFYLLGQALVAKENSIIIFDEPENHLHASIFRKLFDKIESARTDCLIIYLTHDVGFACSRTLSEKVWMKDYDGTYWDYELLNKEASIPEPLYLELLGTREDVLFIEGEIGSLDDRLFSAVYEDLSIKPVGSCRKVFEISSSFDAQRDFHSINSKGIIDRDRRSDEEISNLPTGISVLDVAEVENLFLLPQVVNSVSKHLGKKDILSKVTENVINSFETEVEQQSFEFTKHQINCLLRLKPDSCDLTKLKDNIISLTNLDLEMLNENLLKKFRQLILKKDYESILRIYNQKGIISKSGICGFTGLDKVKDYNDLVIFLINLNTDESQLMKGAILEKVIE